LQGRVIGEETGSDSPRAMALPQVLRSVWAAHSGSVRAFRVGWGWVGWGWGWLLKVQVWGTAPWLPVLAGSGLRVLGAGMELPRAQESGSPWRGWGRARASPVVWDWRLG